MTAARNGTPAVPENPEIPLTFDLDPASLLAVRQFRATFHAEDYLSPALISVVELPRPTPPQIAEWFRRNGIDLPDYLLLSK